MHQWFRLESPSTRPPDFFSNLVIFLIQGLDILRLTIEYFASFQIRKFTSFGYIKQV